MNNTQALNVLLRKRKTPARRPAGEVAHQNLEQLIQKEVKENLADLFGGSSTASQKSMESTIDNMVASSLLNGKQTTGILRSLFGLVPKLIGR